MGCCFGKRRRYLPNDQNCQRCNALFPSGTAFAQVYIFILFFKNFIIKQVLITCFNLPNRQTQYIQTQQQVQQEDRQIPSPSQPLAPLQAIINIQPHQISQSRQFHQNQGGQNQFSRAVLDDIINPTGRKTYQNKELVPGSKIKYQWTKKPIPQITENTPQGQEKQIQNIYSAILSIPYNQIRTMEFPTKQNWLRLNLEKLRIPWQSGSDVLHITKESFLMSTLGAIHGINWHKEVKIIIAGEERVMDAGGLLREWINLLMKEIIHPESGMFQLAETDEITYKINSYADPCDHVLDCFRLLGIVVGKAIFERTPINIYFDRTIIRHMLGQPVNLDDIYSYDKELYQSWLYMKNNDFDPELLMESFVINKRNTKDMVLLKPGGIDIPVNNENKEEYIQLCIDYYTLQSVKPFVEAFLNQFYSIIPKKLISIFEPQELEMILYGIPTIDLDDWRENTDYRGVYFRGHPTIQWFWKVLSLLDQQQLSKFLQFCTGSQRTPVEGFRKLESNRGNTSKFCIESVPFAKTNPFPKAHTCFNRLELPIYETSEDTQLYILSIVQNDLDAVFGME